MAQAQVEINPTFNADDSDDVAVSRAQDGYVPFKVRFRAWWNGTGGTQDHPNITDTTGEPGEDGEVEELSPWAPARLRAIETVWGDGFIEPGGKRYARKVLAVIAPSSKLSVLDLTAGLGGTARALAEQHNLWMDAFEPIEPIAREGHRRSVGAGLGKRVPIGPIDVESVQLQERRYDAIYSRERLFTVANKDHILDQMVRGLKDHGQILVTDILRPDVPDPPEGRAITRQDTTEPHFWTMTQYRRALQERGFQIFLAQDITAEYLDHIHSAWAAVPDVIRRDRLNSAQVSMIMQEGEVWLARSRALIAGEYTIGRLHAQIS